MSNSQAERQNSSTSLQSRYVVGEGEAKSLQLETVLSPSPPLKRAKWDEFQADNTFARSSAAASSLSTMTADVGSFVSQSPTSENLRSMLPSKCNVFTGQMPLLVPQQLTPTCTFSTTCNATLVSDGASRNQASELAEVVAELERERQKNAELAGRVSSLEARLEERERHRPAGICSGSHSDALKQCKQQKKMDQGNEVMTGAIKEEEGVHVLLADVKDGCNGQDSVVRWISREEVQLQDLKRPVREDADSERDEIVESDCTDDDYSSSKEGEDNDNISDAEKMSMKDTERVKSTRNIEGDVSMGAQLQHVDANGKTSDVQTLDIGDHFVMNLPGPIVVRDQGEDVKSDEKRFKRRKKRRRERKKVDTLPSISVKRGLGYEMVPYKVPGMMSPYKKAPKTAFCPKEVKRIMESGVLTLKNAQSHTMRKIIVFASLAIRHGCEDLYDLDFNHFSVTRRGEPYVSAKDPGEHVLYDNPGIRRRIFYPNKQNPVLCPVCILDEEKSMRPIGPSCPSCLFLCIKYGGRTRNLPQNEYVRQRMGRNKLKSFGPLMCQMALLVHIRTGSFFFKALGITLLFMAGFPDEMVRKETKYCNLDLLQKYYRSDEDAEGDLLFHPYPPFYPQALMASLAVPVKVAASGIKGTGKKQPPPLLSKPRSSQTATPLYLPPMTAWTWQGTPFGSPTFSSVAGVGSCPHPQAGIVSSSTGATGAVTSVTPTVLAVTAGTASPHMPPPYGNFPAYPLQCPLAGGYPPMPAWPCPFPAGRFPLSPYGYQQASHYGSAPYYGNPFFPFPPGATKDCDKKDNDIDDSDSDSESSSSGGTPKIEKENISDSKNA